MGALQITGFTDNPRGVKIRYKLARPVSQTTAGPETPLPASAVQFRWQAAVSDTNSPADEMPDPNDRTGKEKLRVLREVLMDGSHVTKAKWQSEEDGTKEISLWLTKAGRNCLAELTADNIGRRLVVVSQGKVLTAPVIMGAINSPMVNLSGNWSQ